MNMSLIAANKLSEKRSWFRDVDSASERAFSLVLDDPSKAFNPDESVEFGYSNASRHSLKGSQ